VSWLCAAVIPVKAIGTWLNLAFSLAWQMIFPRVQSLSPERPFRVLTPCVFHRCSLGFAGVISRKRHDLRPGRTRVTQKRLCRRCRAFTARFTKALESKKRPSHAPPGCGRWCSSTPKPLHHPDQPAAHTAFQTHRARLVSNMGHRSPRLCVARARCPFSPLLRPYSSGGAARGSHTRANFRVSDLAVVS
jgi:hypothetical protein